MQNTRHADSFYTWTERNRRAEFSRTAGASSFSDATAVENRYKVPWSAAVARFTIREMDLFRA